MTSTVQPCPTFERELGRYDRGRAGPTLLVQAGIHGNEPAGVHAVRAVLARLQELDLPLAGRLIALAGNLPALARGERFVQRDLNRQWLPHQLDALLAGGAAGPEDREQRELLQCYERALAARSGPLVFVDLHSSSAEGPPFIVLADTLDNRRTALGVQVPIILGLEETIDGACMEWFSQRGLVNFAVEGGQNRDPDTVRNHEAVLWLLLERLGMLPRGLLDLSAHRAQLQRATAGLPRIVEITQRHAITAADRFTMAPGFANFSRVHKGQVLATQRGAPLTAPAARHVLLPLYQSQGDDGFFLGREVRPFWLRVAAGLRRLRADRIVHWLPGVRRDRDDPQTILVNAKLARWLVTEVFHLLGFRREGRRGDVLTFTARRSLPENRTLRPR